MVDVVELLNHEFVKLVEYIASDQSLARAARVLPRYEGGSIAGEDTGSEAELIRHLWRDAHPGSFEAVAFTFEVKAPLFVLRHWPRYKSWSHNEFSVSRSARGSLCAGPDRDRRAISQQQASSDNGEVLAEQREERNAQLVTLRSAHAEAYEVYKELLDAGWPHEIAQSALPVATYSHMFASVNLLDLWRIFGLRRDARTMYEIRLYVSAMLTWSAR